MKLHKIAYVLVLIGALNWGAEVLGFGLGNFLASNVATVVYILVALAAIYEIVSHKNRCRHCGPGSM